MISEITITNTGHVDELTIEAGPGTTWITGDDEHHRELMVDAAWICITKRRPRRPVIFPRVREDYLPRDPAKPTTATTAYGGRGAHTATGRVRLEQRGDGYEWVSHGDEYPGTAVYVDAVHTTHIWVGRTTDGPRPLVADSPDRTPARRRADEMREAAAARRATAAKLRETTRRLTVFEKMLAVVDIGYPAGIRRGKLWSRALEARRPRSRDRLLTACNAIAWAWGKTTPAAKKDGLLLMIDEPEQHVGPKAQREFIPTLLKGAEIAVGRRPIQVIVNTNSPAILAGAEHGFDAERDRLWSIDRSAAGNGTEATRHELTPRGGAGDWLESGVFGGENRRQSDAEAATTAAPHD